LKEYPEVKNFPDSYCIFTIQGLKLLQQNGFISYIFPNTFCDLENCEDIRDFLLKKNQFNIIWQSGWAFKSAVVDE